MEATETRMTEKEQDARKALQCLFLEVHESIGNDVQQKVLAALDEIKEKNQIAVTALENIANPIKYLQEEAAKDGCTLNGGAAIALAKDAVWLGGLAKSALTKISLK